MNSCALSRTSRRSLICGNQSKRNPLLLLIHPMKNNATNSSERKRKQIPISSRSFTAKTNRSRMNDSSAWDLTSRWNKTLRELTMQMAGFGSELNLRKRCLKSRVMNGRKFMERYLGWTNLQIQTTWPNTRTCNKFCAASHPSQANSCQMASSIKSQGLLVLTKMNSYTPFLCLSIYWYKNLKQLLTMGSRQHLRQANSSWAKRTHPLP